MDYPFETGRKFAKKMDRKDKLAGLRKNFHIPTNHKKKPLIYFTGHSLGLQPKMCLAAVQHELDNWAKLGVLGHFVADSPWFSYHELVADGLAALVGAQSDEVVAMNSLTTNLHLMMATFYRPTEARYKILIEKSAFPSDQFAMKSQLVHHGIDPDHGLIEVAPAEGQAVITTDDVLAVLEEQGNSIAVVMLPGVNYFNGQVFDMAAITAAAHDKGCVVGFDLAHAIGNIPLAMHDWDVDFAVWCHYKYLNAGPGSVGGCYVHHRHTRNPALPRLAGWWGHNKLTRFQSGIPFDPIPTAEGWQLSNPPILQLAALRASLALFDEVGIDLLRERSERLTGYLEFLIDQLPDDKVTQITPREVTQRGCQLSLRVTGVEQGAVASLVERGVVCDFREPDILRVAPVPMYNTFQEIYHFVEILKEIVA